MFKTDPRMTQSRPDADHQPLVDLHGEIKACGTPVRPSELLYAFIARPASVAEKLKASAATR
jgi:hypothetical protein